MKIFTVGLLWACVTLVYLQGVSGRRGGGFRGGGFRGGGSRTSRTSRTRSSSSVRRSTGGSGGGGYRPRFVVPPLLLASSRRRRSVSGSRDWYQQCQRCTASYIYKDFRTSAYTTGTSTSPGAQEVNICREGTAACNKGKCSINYLWANNTITDFPDGVGGSNPAAGRISHQVEAVLICGTLRHAPTLQVTILALGTAMVLRMVGGT